MFLCGSTEQTWPMVSVVIVLIVGWKDMDRDVDHKYVFGVQGYNLKPADLQGSIGLVQLEKQDEIHEKRRHNKQRLHEIFASIPGARVIDEREDAENFLVWCSYRV